MLSKVLQPRPCNCAWPTSTYPLTSKFSSLEIKTFLDGAQVKVMLMDKALLFKHPILAVMGVISIGDMW